MDNRNIIMKIRLILILAGTMLLCACRGKDVLQTPQTKPLIHELLEKIDSADVFLLRKEAELADIKTALDTVSGIQRYNVYREIAQSYTRFVCDSALTYHSKASELAEELGQDSLWVKSEISKSAMLSIAGFYAEAWETILGVPRSKVESVGELESYYNAMSALYHGLYSGSDEPRDFRQRYRALYNVYRDSLLTVSDPESDSYLRNLEKIAARSGAYDKARMYNQMRRERIEDHNSRIYATCVYDKYAIYYVYEHVPSAEAVDDLIRAAIIEVRTCNQDIASLLRLEKHLIDMGEITAAKKVSDYYYRAMVHFGARNRRLAASDQTVLISNKVLKTLNRRNKAMVLAFIFISVLLVIISIILLKINKIRHKITVLNEKLMLSGDITKGYIGVLFQLNASYIKRLETFRSKIHMMLKKGNIDKALELTSLSGYVSADEIKELNNNFDSVFLSIYPNFVQTVNSCLRSDARFVQKAGMLPTELRIIALTKLGIDDTAELADMLRCSVKTIYNLRSAFKGRLAVSEDEFKKTLAEL